jgi:hypothetical protein
MPVRGFLGLDSSGVFSTVSAFRRPPLRQQEKQAPFAALKPVSKSLFGRTVFASTSGLL